MTAPRMIGRLLVANRGEIARRVFATCRRLGIETVAVYSRADADLPFVAEADFALPFLSDGSSPAETYLDPMAVVSAALRMKADAVHPGYGFLSENADFARLVLQEGLTWVGPPPEVIEAMGDKVEAKRIAAAAGVPVLTAPEKPTEADLPLIVKASAGGGGRGMRVVRELGRLESEVAAASAEAESAFGDGTVFLEPYVGAGRHVEVQVVADHHGHVAVLGERDCSVQRRHQKVVEEAPAPRLPDRVRTAVHESARALALAVDYRGVGTVEYLYDAAKEQFFFLEMNTRLQVEHPVTELVLGVDVVELQLGVAEGRELPVLLDDPVVRGHAVEVRLYAEDETHTPQSGPLVTFDVPGDVEFGPLHRAGTRVDAGFADGTEVSTHYDAMLAKVIAWAPTREQATRMLVAALRRARIHGLVTNRDQLVEVLTDPAFAGADVTTTWLDSRERRPAPREDRGLLCAVAAVVLDRAERRTVQRGVPTGWRNVRSQWQEERLVTRSGHEHATPWLPRRDGTIGFPRSDLEIHRTTRLEHGWRIEWTAEGEGSWCDVRLGPGIPGSRAVYVDGPDGRGTFHEVPRFADPADAVASGSLLAPMPGTVVKVVVGTGQEVAPGDPVLVLEAMKMQHTVAAPHAGTVTEVRAEPGQPVAAGEVLAVVSEHDPTEEEAR